MQHIFFISGNFLQKLSDKCRTKWLESVVNFLIILLVGIQQQRGLCALTCWEKHRNEHDYILHMPRSQCVSGLTLFNLKVIQTNATCSLLQSSPSKITLFTVNSHFLLAGSNSENFPLVYLFSFGSLQIKSSDSTTENFKLDIWMAHMNVPSSCLLFKLSYNSHSEMWMWNVKCENVMKVKYW